MSRHSSTSHPYVRISHPDQRKGGGIERQTSADLDEFNRRFDFKPSKRILIDDGVSAFKGLNATPDHQLGKFLAEARRGLIPAGDCLVIENYDRLSRQDPWSAIGLVSELRALKIHVGRLDRMKLLRYDSEDTGDFFEAAVEFMRGNSESRAKSMRNGAAWKRKRKAARENGRTITHRLPAWIREVDGERQAIPERAAVVKRIFQLAANGYGHALIVKKFTAEGVPPMGEADHWARSYIALILKDERTLGRFQPRLRGGEADGDAIPDYYPAVVSQSEWDAARGGAAQRKNQRAEPIGKDEEIAALYREGKKINAIAKQLKLSRPYVRQRLVHQDLLPKPKPRKTARHINVFAGLVKNALGGDSYYVATRTDGGKHARVLINTDAAEGRAKCRSFPFEVFERAVLSQLRELAQHAHEILNGDQGPDESLALAGQLAAVESDLAAMKAFMEGKPFSPTIGAQILDLEAKKVEISPLLAEARQRAVHPLSEDWGALSEHLQNLDAAPDPEEARLHLQSILRRIVDSIQLLVVPRGRDRLAAVQIFLSPDGKRQRSYLVYHKPPKANARGRTEGYAIAGSLADFIELGPMDLRKKADAFDLERQLTALDLNKLPKL